MQVSREVRMEVARLNQLAQQQSLNPAQTDDLLGSMKKVSTQVASEFGEGLAICDRAEVRQIHRARRVRDRRLYIQETGPDPRTVTVRRFPETPGPGIP